MSDSGFRGCENSCTCASMSAARTMLRLKVYPCAHSIRESPSSRLTTRSAGTCCRTRDASAHVPAVLDQSNTPCSTASGGCRHCRCPRRSAARSRAAARSKWRAGRATACADTRGRCAAAARARPWPASTSRRALRRQPLRHCIVPDSCHGPPRPRQARIHRVALIPGARHLEARELILRFGPAVREPARPALGRLPAQCRLHAVRARAARRHAHAIHLELGQRHQRVEQVLVDRHRPLDVLAKRLDAQRPVAAIGARRRARPGRRAAPRGRRPPPSWICNSSGRSAWCVRPNAARNRQRSAGCQSNSRRGENWLA